MNRTTRWLRRLAGGLALAATTVSGAMATTVAEAPAAAADGANSMTSFSITPMGTYVTVNANFGQPRKLWAVVTTDLLPLSSPGHFQPGHGTNIVSNAISLTASRTQQVKVKNLKPNTYYWVHLYEQDANGTTKLLMRNQLTRTKNRLVRVHFDRVYIGNDGDTNGCGEIAFKLQVNGAWGTNPPPYHVTNQADMCDGSTYNYSLVSPWIIDNDNSHTVWAIGEDDDTWFGQICTAGFGGCGDNAELTIQVPLPNEFNDGYNKPFELHAVNNHGLVFKWTGSYTTTYV